MNKKILVVIVVYGNKHGTVSLLEQLEDRFKADELSFSIVENNKIPDNDIKNALSKINLKGFKVYYKHQPSNIGFCAACNMAVKISHNENYIWFLNPDCDVSGIDYYEIISGFEKYKIFGPRTYNENDELTESFKKEWNIWGILRYRFLSYKYAIESFKRKKIKLDKDIQVNWILGACLFVEKEIFLRVNGFDDRFYLCADDTADLIERIRKIGFQPYLNSKMRIIHYGGGSSKDHKSTSLGFGYFGHSYYFYKHKKIISLIILVIILLMSNLIKLVIYYIKNDKKLQYAYKCAIIGLLMDDKKLISLHKK